MEPQAGSSRGNQVSIRYWEEEPPFRHYNYAARSLIQRHHESADFTPCCDVSDNCKV